MSFSKRTTEDAKGNKRCLKTHYLYRVPFSISFDIVVASPHGDMSNQQEILDKHLQDILNDLKNHINGGSDLSLHASLGAPKQILSSDQIPQPYENTIPYEHPDFPTQDDADCSEWFVRKDES